MCCSEAVCICAKFSEYKAGKFKQENSNYHCLKLTLVALMKLPRTHTEVS